MAAMFITRNAMFNLSKAFPQSSTSLSLIRPKVSRVCFTTSASKHSDQGWNPRGGRETSDSDSNDEDRAYEMGEKAKETMKEAADGTKERAQEMKDKSKEHAETAKEKTKGTAEKAADKAKEQAHNVKEKTKEGTHRVAETVTDKAKEGTSKAAEVAQNIGEKAKQTVQGAWGAAKETTQKIREMVVGKSEEEGDDVDDYVEDHVKKNSGPKDQYGGKVMDKDVVEMRRRAGGSKK